jgi:hypothetical protein
MVADRPSRNSGSNAHGDWPVQIAIGSSSLDGLERNAPFGKLKRFVIRSGVVSLRQVFSALRLLFISTIGSRRSKDWALKMIGLDRDRAVTKVVDNPLTSKFDRKFLDALPGKRELVESTL